jgi:hypothetical protein
MSIPCRDHHFVLVNLIRGTFGSGWCLLVTTTDADTHPAVMMQRLVETLIKKWNVGQEPADQGNN